MGTGGGAASAAPQMLVCLMSAEFLTSGTLDRRWQDTMRAQEVDGGVVVFKYVSKIVPITGEHPAHRDALLNLNVNMKREGLMILDTMSLAD